MDEQTAFLLLVTERLDALGVVYMLSGSVALNVYAEPRMTRDIEVAVVSPEDLLLSKLVWGRSGSELQRRAVDKLVRHVPSLDWARGALGAGAPGGCGGP